MKYLIDLIKENGHKLVHYTQGEVGHEYMIVFDYIVKHGGTYDGFRYYNNYYIDITGDKQ